MAGRLAPRSLEEYQRIGNWYLAWCTATGHPAREAQSLRQWRQHLVQTTRLSPHTINLRIAGVKSLVRYSAACGQLDRLLSYDFGLVERVSHSALRHRLKTPRPRRYTPQEIRRLCMAPDASTLLGLRNRALLLCLASSGIRRHELVSLRRGQIVPLGDGWSLQVLGKGQAHERVAPLSQEAYTWIQRWLKARDYYVRTDWIYTTVQGQPLKANSVLWQVKKYAQQVGLAAFLPHDFRRFVGTETAEKHGLRAAQLVLGHKVLRTTEAYYLLDSLQPQMTEGLF
jgi:site-specific recombinase XerD